MMIRDDQTFRRSAPELDTEVFEAVQDLLHGCGDLRFLKSLLAVAEGQVVGDGLVARADLLALIDVKQMIGLEMSNR